MPDIFLSGLRVHSDARGVDPTALAGAQHACSQVTTCDGRTPVSEPQEAAPRRTHHGRAGRGLGGAGAPWYSATDENTMAVRKFAISVPEDVMVQIDEAAEQRGITRTRFITDVLRQVARARTDAEVTRRLDEVFSDAGVAREQRRTSRALLTARVAEEDW